MVTDYDIRCSEFRYREGTLQRARSDVERNRVTLEAEGRSRFGGGFEGKGGNPNPGGQTAVDLEAVLAELRKQEREAPQPGQLDRSPERPKFR